MQGGLVRRKLSVRLSVKRAHCDKMEEKSVPIFYRAAWNAEAI